MAVINSFYLLPLLFMFYFVNADSKNLTVEQKIREDPDLSQVKKVCYYTVTVLCDLVLLMCCLPVG